MRGGVAQLVRASACHAEGREFKSRHSRQSNFRGFLDFSNRFWFSTRLEWIRSEIS